MKLERIIHAETLTGRKKYIVRLTEEERAEVERLTTTGRTAARTLRHAWVLLKADAAPDGPGWTDEQIGDAYGVSLNTIGRIRQAFVEEGPDAALGGGRPPTPPPRKMDGEQEAHLVALLCGPVPGGQARWTVRLLADRFVQLAGSVVVSRETVRRTLKKKCAQTLAADGMVHSPRAER
jgi:transposase